MIKPLVPVILLVLRAQGQTKVKAPADGGVPTFFKGVPPTDSFTDTTAIHSAVISSVNQVSTTNVTAAGSDQLHNPQTPDGYELVFGPTSGANNAPGYMGFAFASTTYNVNDCATLCNSRGFDQVGGVCQFFNIWQGVVNGVPAPVTCAFYYLPTDASTANNFGQGDLQVTFSRGYRRKTLVVDGGFEGYTGCNGDPDDLCFTSSDANWIGTSPKGGEDDASIFHYQPYAHTGNSVALLGSADGADALEGTLTPRKRLPTKAGSQYVIAFFQNSLFSGPDDEQNAIIEVLWNGNVVKTIQPGFQDWTYYFVTVTAKGNDLLALRGGQAPAWSFIDDVNVFLS